MWKQTTLVSLSVVFIALFQTFHPVISAPTIGNQIYTLKVPAQSPQTPIIENENETQCELCYSDNNMTDICYFNCKPSTDYPKGHIYCNDCVVKVAFGNKPCPYCRAYQNNTKVNDLLTKDPLSAWTFILDKLKYNDFDLTHLKKILRFQSPNEMKQTFNDLKNLLLCGVSLYYNNQNIIYNALHFFLKIQLFSKENPENGVGNDTLFYSENRVILNEYLKYENYIIVLDIIEYVSESDKIDIINILGMDKFILVSFEYKSTGFLYNYLKNMASQQDRKNYIMKVIDYATDYCVLNGLLELIHTIFKEDKILTRKLTIEVFNRSQYYYQESGDYECSLESTNDYVKYLSFNEMAQIHLMI